MLTARQVDLIQTSFATAISTSDTFIEDFYQALFVKAPSLQRLFSGDIAAQSEKLAAILQLAVQKLDDQNALVEPLRGLGAQHAQYGTRPAHYTALSDALVECLQEAVGPDWTPDHTEAWNSALTFMSQTMQDGADMAAPRH